jgi:hypothetical protein
MSQAFEAWIQQTFSADSVIAGLVGKDSNGLPAVMPYHARDTDENLMYPHVTYARFGDITERGVFQDSPIFSTAMDGPRVALCVWSRNDIQEAYTVYNRIDQLMRGPAALVASTYFSSYKIRRTHLRDDLFDETAKAFHIHSEYSLWVQYPSTV